MTSPARAGRAPRISAAQARTQIVVAAERLLSERRFRDLTVDEVMAAAGLSRTAFYRHFRSLPDVVLDLLADLVRQVAAEADIGDPRDRGIMRRQLALVVQTFRDHGPLLLALEEAAHYDDEVERAYTALRDSAVDLTTELLRRGIAEGHTPPMPVRDVAHALSVMNARYLLDLCARDPRFDAEAALEALWTVWTRTTWPAELPRAGAAGGATPAND
jgi:AcrR family transcriptional regulator